MISPSLKFPSQTVIDGSSPSEKAIKGTKESFLPASLALEKLSHGPGACFLSKFCIEPKEKPENYDAILAQFLAGKIAGRFTAMQLGVARSTFQKWTKIEYEDPNQPLCS